MFLAASTGDQRSQADPRIRAICFDFGNVLVSFDYNRLWENLSSQSTISESEIARRFSESELPRLYESGKISSQRFYREMCSLLKVRLSYEDFCRAWSSIFDASARVDHSFMSSLAKDYILVLLSNTNDIHFTFMRQHFRILREIHHFALSYQVGVTKPGREIYLAALNLAQVNPNEAFYADDIKSYVEAGRALGLRAAQVRTRDELVGAMSLCGITPPA